MGFFLVIFGKITGYFNHTRNAAGIVVSAIVDFTGTKVEALTGLEDVKKGDRVLVHAGCVIRVMPEEEADETEEIFRELASLTVEDMKERSGR